MVDFLGQPVENLPGYKPPQLQLTPPPPALPPPPRVVDRVEYLQAQRQAQIVRGEGDARRGAQMITMDALADNAGLQTLQRAAAPVLRLRQLGEQFEREDALRRIQQVEDRGNFTTPATETYRRQLEYARQFGTLGQHRGPGLLGQAAGAIGAGARAAGGGLADIARGVADAGITLPTSAGLRTRGSVGGELTTADVVEGARTDIPYSEQVMEIAGEVGRRAAQDYLRSLQGPLGARIPVVNKGVEDIPVVGRAQQALLDVAGKGGEVALESFVPTEVWMLALELVPGVGFGPDALRGARRLITAASEAGVDLTPAGLRAFAKSDAGQNVIRIIKGEAGGGIGGGGLGQGPEDLLRASRGEAADEQAIAGQMENRLLSLAQPPESVTKLLAKRGAKPTEATAESWSVLPPSYQKFVTVMADMQPLSTRERKVLLSSRRREIAAKLKDIQARTDLTPQQKLIEAQAAKAGRIIPAQEAIAKQFTPEEMTEIWDGITKAVDSKQISPWEHDNAVNAVNLLFHGERLVQKDLPLALMPSEIKLLGRVFGPEFQAALPRSTAELSAFQQAVQFVTLPRALQAGFDISAPGRQGILLAPRNAMEWLKSWKPMFKAMSSEKGFEASNEAIRLNPRFDEALEHGVDFTFPGATETAEEAFQSRYIDKLPLGVNRLLRGSERGYTTFLNNLRMLVYEKNANRIHRAAERNAWDAVRVDKELDDLAWFTNVASGRGDLSAVKNYVPALNVSLFSPRYVASQPQSIYALIRSSPETRKIVAENLAAFFGSGGAMLAAIKMSGLADVEIDPRSTDFGKIRVGNQRINFWGSWQPLARYTAQIASGQRKDDLTGTIEDRKFSNAITAFLRSKLSPAFGVVYDLTVGDARSYEGKDLTKPANLGFYGLDQITPLFIQDLREAYQNEGVTGLPIGALGVTGISTQTYKPRESEEKAAAKSGARDSLSKAGVPFADDKIDFRQPQLDGKPNGDKTQRQIIAETLKIEDVPDDASMSALRAAYIEQKTQAYMESAGVGEAEARYALGNAFDRFPAVETINANAEAAIMNYWRAHPDKLREALDAGLTPPSKEKLEILSGQGSRD